MTRLDQLAQPTRRNGEHIRAVIERQRQFESNSMTNSVTSNTFSQSNKSNTHSMSRSLTHLAGNNSTSSGAKKVSGLNRLLRKTNTSNSMSQLHVIKHHTTRNAKFNKTHQMNDAGANISAAGVFICFTQLSFVEMIYANQKKNKNHFRSFNLTFAFTKRTCR